MNLGYQRWCEIQKKWKEGEPKKRKQTPVDVENVVDYLVNPRKPAFKQPVPLPEMIKILVELWEADSADM